LWRAAETLTAVLARGQVPSRTRDKVRVADACERFPRISDVGVVVNFCGRSILFNCLSLLLRGRARDQQRHGSGNLSVSVARAQLLHDAAVLDCSESVPLSLAGRTSPRWRCCRNCIVALRFHLARSTLSSWVGGSVNVSCPVAVSTAAPKSRKMYAQYH